MKRDAMQGAKHSHAHRHRAHSQRLSPPASCGQYRSDWKRRLPTTSADSTASGRSVVMASSGSSHGCSAGVRLCLHFLVNWPATHSETQPNKAPMMTEAIVGTIASSGASGFNRISPATDAKP